MYKAIVNYPESEQDSYLGLPNNSEVEFNSILPFDGDSGFLITRHGWLLRPEWLSKMQRVEDET